eukprot:s4424_g1.t4
MPLCAQDDGDAVQAAREELALLQGLRPDAKPHGAGKFARLLRHPAIVQALAVDETSGQLQMVFAFLSGASFIKSAPCDMNRFGRENLHGTVGAEASGSSVEAVGPRKVTAPAAGAQATASSASSPARPRSAAEVVASRKPSEPIAEDAVQKAAMVSAPPLSRPSSEEGRKPDSTLADDADAAPREDSEPPSQPSEAPASSQTSSPPALALAHVPKDKELALLSRNEPGKKVTRRPSGSHGQGRGNEASSGSQSSASAGGTPAAAVLTDGSSISSESRSGDPASSADAASIPLETEGHAEGPVDAEPLETGEAASSAVAGSLSETAVESSAALAAPHLEEVQDLPKHEVEGSKAGAEDEEIFFVPESFSEVHMAASRLSFQQPSPSNSDGLLANRAFMRAVDAAREHAAQQRVEEAARLPGGVKTQRQVCLTTINKEKMYEGKIVKAFKLGLLLDINADVLGLLRWRHVRGVPRKLLKEGGHLANLRVDKVGDARFTLRLECIGHEGQTFEEEDYPDVIARVDEWAMEPRMLQLAEEAAPTAVKRHPGRNGPRAVGDGEGLAIRPPPRFSTSRFIRPGKCGPRQTLPQTNGLCSLSGAMDATPMPRATAAVSSLNTSPELGLVVVGDTSGAVFFEEFATTLLKLHGLRIHRSKGNHVLQTTARLRHPALADGILFGTLQPASAEMSGPRSPSIDVQQTPAAASVVATHESAAGVGEQKELQDCLCLFDAPHVVSLRIRDRPDGTSPCRPPLQSLLL